MLEHCGTNTSMQTGFENIYLQTCQSSAFPKQTFNPARTHAETQLCISQRLRIFLHLFKTEGTVAKQPATKNKTTITVKKSRV